MPDYLPDCQAAATAVIVVGLAVTAFVLAYITKTVGTWMTWKK